MARRAPRGPCLPPAELERLARAYQAAAEAWQASPRIAPTVERLACMERLARELGEAVGELRPAVLAVLGIERTVAAAKLELAGALQERSRAALDDLAARGAAKGGNRRLAALFEPGPPKFRLAQAVRTALIAAGCARPSKRQIADHMADVLSTIGEPSCGLTDVVSSLPKLEGKPRLSTVGYPL